MSFMAQYHNLMTRVESAVGNALKAEVAEAVKDVMENQLEHQVYSYEASAEAMATRRLDSGGLLDRQFMVSDVTQTASIPMGAREAEFELTLEDTAPFQGTQVKGKALSDVVEKGIEGFNQPGPRPFVAGTQEQATDPETDSSYRASGKRPRALSS